MSFLAGEVKENVDDLFSGIIIDGKLAANGNHAALDKKAFKPSDVFGTSTNLPLEQENQKIDVDDLMAGLSTTTNEKPSNMKQKGSSSEAL
ncbi:hypothetical protein SLEP1_g36359 [Rubroshorea leprosula]|uniref:Uncharacterized protein n=1 Tax=Rubroshorea leprosula TaxID=152421 RepID=A0AAV5KR76_9ROSI|nr:hypothetical protein SLEP1_g36359 [Rubroshorea leprosula]